MRELGAPTKYGCGGKFTHPKTGLFEGFCISLRHFSYIEGVFQITSVPIRKSWETWLLPHADTNHTGTLTNRVFQNVQRPNGFEYRSEIHPGALKNTSTVSDGFTSKPPNWFLSPSTRLVAGRSRVGWRSGDPRTLCLHLRWSAIQIDSLNWFKSIHRFDNLPDIPEQFPASVTRNRLGFDECDGSPCTWQLDLHFHCQN